ncbi:hypothetical protein [Aeromonas rivipollensis]|uniref:hypothetical protein n=1 Tax=Aeromonas rivipollensis TaxID=948519 RepID=UPI003D2606C2
MKKVLITVFALTMAGTASAALPQLNYECPGKIQMHSDEGGPVYINGKEAKLKKFNDNREFNFEVRHSPMPPDGTLRIP